MVAMVNYTTWLGDGNNAELDPPAVILNTTGLPSNEMVNLKADLHIRYYIYLVLCMHL